MLLALERCRERCVAAPTVTEREWGRGRFLPLVGVRVIRIGQPLGAGHGLRSRDLMHQVNQHVTEVIAVGEQTGRTRRTLQQER